MAAMPSTAAQRFFDGTRHLAAQDAASAEACFREAVAIEPDLGEAHANLGWLAEAAGRLDEAEACYRRALALRPSQPTIHLNHAALLARLKRFDEALAGC
jgi:Tfp pilus assembly protein PilF